MSTHFSVRVTPEERIRWSALANRFGYDTTSEFLRAVMLAMGDRYQEDEWQSGLVHLDQNRVTGQVVESAELSQIYAFPVAAPARFWRYLKHVTTSLDEVREREQS